MVTGASKGIGVAIARRLSAEGAAVALLPRTGSSLSELADDLGASATAFTCGVSDPASMETDTFKRIDGRYGRLDLLVNNAGIIGMSLLADASDENVLGQVATNLVGPILCSRAAIPLLQAAWRRTHHQHLVPLGGVGPSLPVGLLRPPKAASRCSAGR